MIQDVDQALKALIKRDALKETDVDVLFDAPTKDWAARRNGPTVDAFLYDIREDTRRRTVGPVDVIGDDGFVSGRRPPPRFFQLSYLLTAWTQRPEDEHRLLSALLACFLLHDTVPTELLPESLAAVTIASLLHVALPPTENHKSIDVWSAMGGELKPSLDLVVTAPLDTGRFLAAGPPVLETPKFTMAKQDAGEAVKARRRARSAPKPQVAQAPNEQVQGGNKEQPGRILRVGKLGPR